MRWVMLDRIIDMKEGRSAAAIKAVTASEDYFEHHFWRFPIVPGSMILEMLAQIGGRLANYSSEKQTGEIVISFPTSVEDVRYYGFVRPGDTIRLQVELVRLEETSAVVEAEAQVDGNTVATCRYEFNLEPVHSDELRAFVRNEMAELWDRYDLQ